MPFQGCVLLLNERGSGGGGTHPAFGKFGGCLVLCGYFTHSTDIYSPNPLGRFMTQGTCFSAAVGSRKCWLWVLYYRIQHNSACCVRSLLRSLACFSGRAPLPSPPFPEAVSQLFSNSSAHQNQAEGLLRSRLQHLPLEFLAWWVWAGVWTFASLTHFLMLLVQRHSSIIIALNNLLIPWDSNWPFVVIIIGHCYFPWTSFPSSPPRQAQCSFFIVYPK
jgi:hypothetical protein